MECIKWIVRTGDILQEPADILICSANILLNLSGGVGGEILLRYGDGMQLELHEHLARRGIRFVQQGDVITTGACGTPFKAVLHAVAVDAFYQSSAEVIAGVVSKSLALAASLAARRIALTALGTGFGRLSMKEFANGIAPLMSKRHPPVKEVVICVRKEWERAELAGALDDARQT